MNILKSKFRALIAGLILISVWGCEHTPENQKPGIKFTHPLSNLTVSGDTTITFNAESFDNDGSISRVEFSINGTIVQLLNSAPYTFNWNLLTEDNLGINSVKATAYDNKDAKAEAEIMVDVKSYLSNWLGAYSGTSDHWSSYPVDVSGQWQIVTYHTYNDVLVNVSKSSLDSCLDFIITYNDSIVETRDYLNFSTTGIHSSNWGGGSGYGSLNIQFNTNSLNYHYFQKCGIPCSSGIDFNINRQ